MSDNVERICILNGIHKGVVISLGDDPVLIGGGADCDALLSDASVSDAAVRITRVSRGRFSATTVRGEVRKNDRVVHQDKLVSFGDGATICLGDVRLCAGGDLSSAKCSVDRRTKRRTMLGWGGACAASLALLGVLGVVSGPADAYNSAAQETGLTASVMETLRNSENPMPELKKKIVSNNLVGRVKVDELPSGQMLATGKVSAAERDRWNAIVRWFDGRFGDRMVLESRVALGNNNVVLPFKIISVMAAPNPRVVIQNGNSFPVGSYLPGGWELRRIEHMSVVLAREDRELAIDF